MRFLQEYHKEHGYMPSYREIGAAVGLSSTASVCSQLHSLTARGEIETEHPGSPRAFRLSKKE